VSMERAILLSERNPHSGHEARLSVNDLVRLNQELRLLKESIGKKKAQKEQSQGERKEAAIDLSPEIQRLTHILSEVDGLSKDLKAEEANSLRKVLDQMKAEIEANTSKSARPKRDSRRAKNTQSRNVGKLHVAKNRLQQYAQQVVAMKDRETAIRNEIESLRGEVRSLRERLISNVREVQELRTLIEEQRIHLRNEQQKTEVKNTEVAEERHATTRLPTETFLPTSQPPFTLPPSTEFERNDPHQQPLRRCGNCGRPLKPHDQFCDVCGFQAYPEDSRAT